MRILGPSLLANTDIKTGTGNTTKAGTESEGKTVIVTETGIGRGASTGARTSTKTGMSTTTAIAGTEARMTSVQRPQ